MKWTNEDVAAFNARKAARRAKVNSPVIPDSSPNPRPKRGMNKLEAAYAGYLELQKKAGEIEDWGYEKIKFRLADGKWWKPDFMVTKSFFGGVTSRGKRTSGFLIEIHETKGFDREAAALKRSVAAELFPWFDFYLVKRAGHMWKIRKVGG